jgi:hypothetical protein
LTTPPVPAGDHVQPPGAAIDIQPSPYRSELRAEAAERHRQQHATRMAGLWRSDDGSSSLYVHIWNYTAWGGGVERKYRLNPAEKNQDRQRGERRQCDSMDDPTSQDHRHFPSRYLTHNFNKSEIGRAALKEGCRPA